MIIHVSGSQQGGDQIHFVNISPAHIYKYMYDDHTCIRM